MSTKNTVAKAKSSAVALPHSYGEDAGAGVDITMDDLKIPFIVLAQTESKVLIEDSEKYVPGGKVGDILNSASRVYTPGKTGMLIVPAFIENSIVEFLPNNAGFVAKHGIDGPEAAILRTARLNKEKPKTLDGNDLVRTKTLISVQLDEEMNPDGYVVIPFSASKLAAWTNYFTVLHGSKTTKSAPLFANVIRIVSKDDKNREGKRYKNYDMFPGLTAEGKMATSAVDANAIGSLLAPDSPAYLAARELRDQWISGAAKADTEGDLSADEGDSGGHF